MQTFDIIQVLRFVAAFLVVIYHIQLGSAGHETFEGLFDFVQRGAAGVDIFFVISGFIIAVTVVGKPAFDVKRFAFNRFFRIYPTYWVFLTLAVMLGYISHVLTGQSTTHDMLSPSSLLVSYLLVPVQTQIYPVAWTLTLEISFYLIFCLFYWLAGLRGVIISLIAWYVAARIYGLFFAPGEGEMIWFFHSVVLEFLYGVLIAIAWFKDRIRFASLAFVLGGISFAATVGGFFDGIGLGREFTQGLPAALLIYGAVGLQWKAPRWAVLAGDSSYILYLMHPLLISTISVLSAKFLGLDASTNNGLIVLILFLSVVISMAMTYLIERPYITWYKDRLARPATQKPQVVLDLDLDEDGKRSV